jgi:cardiolipin synthase
MQNDAQRVTEEALQRRGVIGRWVDACAYLMLRFGVAVTGKSSEY